MNLQQKNGQFIKPLIDLIFNNLIPVNYKSKEIIKFQMQYNIHNIQSKHYKKELGLILEKYRKQPNHIIMYKK